MSSSSRIADQSLRLKDNTQLRYGLAVPDKYEERGEEAPLVLALHYGWRGTLPPSYGREFMELLILPALEELGAYVAAPDCPDRSWTTERSEKALLELVDYLQETYDLGSRKVIVAGYSLGAIGSWYLISKHPGRFCAAVILSGRARAEWLAEIPSIPVYVIHSRRDELIPFADIEKQMMVLKERNPALVFVPVDGISHYQTQRFVRPLKGAVPWLREILARPPD